MSTSSSTTDAEVAALNRLAAAELSGLPGGIGGMHSAISGRVFGALGPLGAPVRIVHDATAGAFYRGAGGGLRTLFAGAGSALWRPGVRPPSATPAGAALIAAVN